MGFTRNYLVSVFSAIFALSNGALFDVDDARNGGTRDVPAEIRLWLKAEELGQQSEVSSNDDDLLTAKQAYVWGWPLVYMNHCRRSLAILSGPGVSGGSPVAPPNQLSMLSDFIAPESFAVPCPNQDVVYGFGVLDLRNTSVVLQVPDLGGRFWLFQLGDHRTESFAQIGSMYHTPPGHYLVVGPNWDGTAIEGMQGILRCPTNLGFCLPRIYMDGSDDDRKQVQKQIERIQIYPSSKYTGKWKTRDWTRSRWYPMVAAGNRLRCKWVEPETFFDSLEEVLKEIPPLPNEVGFYERMQQLLNRSRLDPAFRRELVKVAKKTDRDYVSPLFEFQQNGSAIGNGWRSLRNGAAFGTDYTTRTAIARSNIFVNRHEEAKYFYLDLDGQGQRLNGSHRYTMTFPKEELPPSQGFWSLTLYDKNHRLFVNPQNRYAIGTRTRDLVQNEDGSTTIFIQPDPPSAESQSNWLPAPKGEFSLYLRVYGPDPCVLSGAWLPPAADPSPDHQALVSKP